MKTYNERLPLIDAAIEATDGDIERIKDYRKTDTHINYTVKLGYFSVDSQWAFCGDTVCTHEEFEQRARELGYKPKEQDMNDWYEKGELPPVGEICNYKTSLGKSVKVEITAHSRMGICFCEVGKDGESYVSKGQILNFEPLRTGTDKLVEEALEILKNDYATHLAMSDLDMRMCAETMIEAGYRKIKPMDKDEFVQDAIKHFSSIRFDLGKVRLICDSLRKLHSAGCRFLDQGE